MDKSEGLQQIERTRLIAIVRGPGLDDTLRTAEALCEGGVTVMEVTLNTEGALSTIGELQRRFGGHMFVGAGTVLDADDARRAVEAGARFIVTPNTDEDTIRYTAGQGLPAFPGAMTPTEIVRAWKAGATAVKIFPSAGLGLPYLKELQGPLSHIPMVAVGGVNEDNIRDVLDIGCYAVGIGGSLINLSEIRSGNFAWITEKAKRLSAKVREWRAHSE